MTPESESTVEEARNPMRKRMVLGFTLIEIMIAILVLAVVSSSVVMGMVNLNNAEKSAKERAVVMAMARSLSERVLGGTWDTLGRNVSTSTLADQNSWSWNRREYPSDPVLYLPPMDEVSANPLNRLDYIPGPGGNPLSPAISPVKTGLRNIKIYLEYYRETLMTDMLIAPDPRALFKQVCTTNQTPLAFDDTNQFLMDLRNDNESVMCRILVTWTSPVGEPQRYELTFSRRK